MDIIQQTLKHSVWECKYHVAQIVGFIKGCNAISIAWIKLGRRKNFTGQRFWARGYFVSTVERDEQRYGIIFNIKKTKIENWINCHCFELSPLGNKDRFDQLDFYASGFAGGL